MRKTWFLLATVVISALAALAVPLGQSAAASTTTATTFGVLAGAPGWLVYTRSDHTGFTVHARSRDGRQRLLAGATESDRDWSVTDGTVVALRSGGSPQTVAWWDLRTKRHGTLRLPGSDLFLGAAPGGFFAEKLATGALQLRTTSGAVHALGQPFAGRSFFGASPGPKGIVLSSGDQVTYLRYGRPGVFRPLTTGLASGSPVGCDAVSARYAACYDTDDSTDADPVLADSLVSLKGADPTVTSICPGLPSVVGHSMVWVVGSSPTDTTDSAPTPHATCEDFTPAGIAASTTGVATSRVKLGAVGVSAYGRLVTVNRSAHKVLMLSSPAHRVVLLPKAA